VLGSPALAAEASDKPTQRDDQVCGFYLHACWDYAYPFAVRKWKAKDYEAMFTPDFGLWRGLSPC
jgi:hypothetical protein